MKAEDIVDQSDHDDDLKSDIYYRLALCIYNGYGIQIDWLAALEYINFAETCSYYDRFAGKFMWQSTAKELKN